MINYNNSNREQQLCICMQITSDFHSAEASGTKVKDWLKANNIPKDTYYCWYRKVKDSYMSSSLPEIVLVSEAITPSIASAPVSCPSISDHSLITSTETSTSKASSIKLSINDVNIEVTELTNPELLTSVIKAVRYA